MAEDPVSQDQHRADMAELRLELTNALASLDKRTELIAQDLAALRRELTERFEHTEQQAAERFERAEWQTAERFEHMERQTAERFEHMERQTAERFEHMERQTAERFEQVERHMAEGRETMLLRFEQMDQRFEQVNQRFGQIDLQFARHETRLLNLENWMRTTFVTVALVAVGVASQLFYTLLRFGLKPPTP
ncbi:MAG: hypothetical protein OEU26_12400 [Candidatus Tectomicrobia bacterium]|nr:hypothetical protein [Candidatus Tectomicrobia bacterium]